MHDSVSDSMVTKDFDVFAIKGMMLLYSTNMLGVKVLYNCIVKVGG